MAAAHEQDVLRSDYAYEHAVAPDHEHVWLHVYYGKPAEVLIQKAAAGEAVLAGCAMYDGAPREQCKVCGLQR